MTTTDTKSFVLEDSPIRRVCADCKFLLMVGTTVYKSDDDSEEIYCSMPCKQRAFMAELAQNIDS